MITFVLQDPRDDRFFVRHQPEWNYGCGGDERSDRIDEAAVFRAEWVDGTLTVTSAPETPKDTAWVARTVQLTQTIKEPPRETG